MGLPICKICAESRLLCPNCESRLAAGEISELDVELSRVLVEFGGEIGFIKTIDDGENVIILSERDDLGKLIGRAGANIQKISRRLKRKVRVVGAGEVEEMIHDIAAPAKVSGVGVAYKPDGGKITRVKISSREKEKLRLKPEAIEKLLSSLSGNPVEIQFV